MSLTLPGQKVNPRFMGGLSRFRTWCPPKSIASRRISASFRLPTPILVLWVPTRSLFPRRLLADLPPQDLTCHGSIRGLVRLRLALYFSPTSPAFSAPRGPFPSP